MSHAILSRERTNHDRRHCARRATLAAQLAADCTSDASASASDENSAALEPHEPIVPLAGERPPGCARTIARAGCRPVVTRAELAAFGPSMRSGGTGAVACVSRDKERPIAFDRPNEPILASDQALCGAPQTDAGPTLPARVRKLGSLPVSLFSKGLFPLGLELLLGDRAFRTQLGELLDSL
jgi:hypothetical protein